MRDGKRYFQVHLLKIYKNKFVLLKFEDKKINKVLNGK